MTTYRVEVGSFAEVAELFDGLARDIDDILTDALKGAIIDGGYLKELTVRIPKSEMAKYASQLKGTDADGNPRQVMLEVRRAGKADGTGWRYSLPNSWFKRFGISDADRNRIREQYGHGRLLKSIIPDGNPDGAISVRKSGRDIELVLGSSLDYAVRMHQAKRPAEGEYWTPGRRTGWSTPRTGNRYFEVAYEKSADRIMRQFQRNLNTIFRQRGMM